MSAKILPNFAGRKTSGRSSPRKHSPSGKQDLQFVNLPNDLKLDVAARRRVRSHVARDFRRRARVSSSSSLDVDLNLAKQATKAGGLGQRHRFRFGQHGLQETGKHAIRKSIPRRVPSVSQHSPLSLSSIIPSANITEDPGGSDIPGIPSLRTRLATEGFIQSVSIDTSYSSISNEEELYATSSSSSSDTNREYWTTSQKLVDQLESAQMVSRPRTVHEYPHVQKLHIATTGTGNLDPFGTMPIVDSSCRTQALMHHFHLRIMASPLMMNPRKEWFSLAVQDHALFHVALSHAAGNLGLLMRKGDSVESLLHRMEAIRIINERLNDLSCGISDGTIGAVASMASYEATNGTLEGVLTHMNGLEQMVESRGGFQEGGFSSHLRRLIAWADLNSANALSTAPRFPPLSDRQDLQSDQFAIDPVAFQLYSTPLSPIQSSPTTIDDDKASATPYSAAISDYSDIQALAPKLAYCFITLRQLSRLLSIAGPKAVIRMDHTWYSDMAYTLQRRLMHLGSTTTISPLLPSSNSTSLSSSPPSASQPSSRITRPCCLAALIYLECCIREIHPRSRIIETLVTELHAALLQLKGLTTSVRMSHLAFWALAIGVAASGDLEREHAWFVAQLGALCSFLRVRGWETARTILQGVLWPEREGELTRALVWAEVEMADRSIDCWTVGSD